MFEGGDRCDMVKGDKEGEWTARHRAKRAAAIGAVCLALGLPERQRRLTTVG